MKNEKTHDNSLSPISLPKKETVAAAAAANRAEAEAAGQYAAEAKARWGKTAAYQESEKRHAGYTPVQEAAIQQEAEEIFAAFAALRGTEPTAPAAQALAARWQAHITRWHYPCSKEILAGLALMYTEDPRFTANLDTHGPGTAAFMRAAIEAYCKA